ncbi:LlaJI family restriction endonuclease [Wohlfahrtiimonas chitiniclastica]|uniref:LlaJI family restriction endonuclease n=1 Tax=Wohlfahrtiimonas chitiniclastica TaxID=400946 RepID=UPI00164BDCE5|nr:LlaJI family restriction endonuclease [Wohlfahrtiimonas chitiniclastica]
MSKIKYFTDRMLISNLPPNLVDIIFQKGLVTAGGSKVSFCGMILLRDYTAVFFPRSTDLSKLQGELGHNESKQLVKALRKYVDNNRSSIGNDENIHTLNGFNLLSLYEWFLEDYINYGLYFRRDKKRITNGSSIDWNKTINTEIPHIVDNSPVYLITHGLSNTTNSQGIIARIHCSIVKYIYERIEFILDKIGLPELDDYPLEKSFFNEIRSYVLTELREAYSERDILLLKNILRFLEQEESIYAGNTMIGVQYFQYAWEFMLSEILLDRINVHHLFPVPRYVHMDGSESIDKRRSLRTDIVIKNEENKTVSIIDAKYYEASEVYNSPSWPDILKQLYYAKFLTPHYMKYNIENYFLFPGQVSKFSQINIEDHEPIKCIYIDPIRVLTYFLINKNISFNEMYTSHI